MALFVMTDEQSAAMARERLEKALLNLARAQADVAEALGTLRMFETSMRQAKLPDQTTTVTGGTFDWPEVTGRNAPTD